MTNRVLYLTYTDINLHPGRDNGHPSLSTNQLTLGDLHGNALKLLHFLCVQNIIAMTPGAYSMCVELYHKPVLSLTSKHLALFKN